jgi:hypothetical protein
MPLTDTACHSAKPKEATYIFLSDEKGGILKSSLRGRSGGA